MGTVRVAGPQNVNEARQTTFKARLPIEGQPLFLRAYLRVANQLFVSAMVGFAK